MTETLAQAQRFRHSPLPVSSCLGVVYAWTKARLCRIRVAFPPMRTLGQRKAVCSCRFWPFCGPRAEYRSLQSKTWSAAK